MATASAEIARRWQQAGTLAADADPDQVGAAMLSLLQGYMLQLADQGHRPGRLPGRRERTTGRATRQDRPTRRQRGPTGRETDRGPGRRGRQACLAAREPISHSRLAG
ncbi:hypothetical protein ADK66_05000 [Micromonospora sp. NRRL B-16802]|nr:hypothetical protein ADK66_05000 [Micromonospora sp. NRRL B-16802]